VRFDKWDLFGLFAFGFVAWLGLDFVPSMLAMMMLGMLITILRDEEEGF
jgi:hypothetical protein